MDKEHFVQNAAQGTTWVTKWLGVSGSVYGVLTLNEWLGVFSLLVAIAGTVYNSRVNRYYKEREDSRAQERHEALKASWLRGGE